MYTEPFKAYQIIFLYCFYEIYFSQKILWPLSPYRITPPLKNE